MLSFKSQKYIFNLLLLTINLFLCICLSKFHQFWYLYLIILSPNSFLLLSMILTLVLISPYNLYKKYYKIKERIINKNIAYILPCYNESYDELKNSIESFVNQSDMEEHNKILIICCDGKVKGINNNESTDIILCKKLLGNYITEKIEHQNAYKTWYETYNDVDMYHGIYKNLPFILIIKHNNVGKRDSITLIRRNLYLYNNKNDSELFNKPFNEIQSFNLNLFTLFAHYNLDYFDAIIGTDGDTILDTKCSYHLINDLFNYKNNNLVGIAGFIKISPMMKWYSPWVIYQHTSYLAGQVIFRFHQSKVTQKVNCLPGCIQILRVCKEVCGYKILNEFNRLPNENEPLYRHLRAHMGEDRMHICTMMHMYPYIKTKQSIKAFAYTQVPDTWKIFLSQRRRWSLGANSNKLILVTKSKINLYEKISTILSILAWFLTIFFSFAAIHICISLIKLDYNNLSTLQYITIISIINIIAIPKLYLLSMPLWLHLTKREIIQLYIGLVLWLPINIPITLIIHIYTLINLDNHSWGKTREIKDNDNLSIDIIDSENDYNDAITPK